MSKDEDTTLIQIADGISGPYWRKLEADLDRAARSVVRIADRLAERCWRDHQVCDLAADLYALAGTKRDRAHRLCPLGPPDWVRENQPMPMLAPGGIPWPPGAFKKPVRGPSRCPWCTGDVVYPPPTSDPEALMVMHMPMSACPLHVRGATVFVITRQQWEARA